MKMFACNMTFRFFVGMDARSKSHLLASARQLTLLIIHMMKFQDSKIEQNQNFNGREYVEKTLEEILL